MPPTALEKCTIAKAIELSLNPKEMLQSLTPFAPLDKKAQAEEAPSLSGIDDIKSVSIFNDAYVQQFVFKPDELLTNSFQIFVKNAEYDARHAEIEAALSGIKEAFFKRYKH